MNKSILLFDSSCNLCLSSIAFVTKGDKQNRILQYPIESEEGLEVLKQYPYLKDVDSIIYINQLIVYTKSDAVIEISKNLSFPHNLMYMGRFVPLTWRNRIYDWVAKNRYTWFGKNG